MNQLHLTVFSVSYESGQHAVPQIRYFLVTSFDFAVATTAYLGQVGQSAAPVSTTATMVDAGVLLRTLRAFKKGAILHAQRGEVQQIRPVAQCLL